MRQRAIGMIIGIVVAAVIGLIVGTVGDNNENELVKVVAGALSLSFLLNGLPAVVVYHLLSGSVAQRVKKTALLMAAPAILVAIMINLDLPDDLEPHHYRQMAIIITLIPPMAYAISDAIERQTKPKSDTDSD